jgi:hypothetical protein
MGSFRGPRFFDPLDLEIIDRVYESVWAQLEARDPFRDRTQDDQRREALRKHVFDMAHSHIVGTHPVNFDLLHDLMMASMSEPWVMDYLTAAE